MLGKVDSPPPPPRTKIPGSAPEGYWKNDYFYFQAFVVYVSHTVNVLVTDVILNIKIPEQLKFTYFISLRDFIRTLQ